MESLEQKLKIENELLSMKRELKNVTAQVSAIKAEYAAISELKSATEKQINEQKEYLNTIHNEISQAKLDWARERSEEMDKLSQKLAEAENVIKRKAELNEQEETLRKIQSENTDILNESRRISLKIDEEKATLDSQQKQILEYKKEIDAEKELNDKKMADFKASALKLIKGVEKL